MDWHGQSEIQNFSLTTTENLKFPLDVPHVNSLVTVCGDERRIRRDGVEKSPMIDSRTILRKAVSFALWRP